MTKKQVVESEKKVLKYLNIVDIDSGDSDDNNEEQVSLRNIKPMTKRTFLRHSTDPGREEIEVGEEEESVFTKGIYKNKKTSYVAKLGSNKLKRILKSWYVDK